MRELTQAIGEHGESHAREKAVAAFLYLGDKLRALYARDHGEPVSAEATATLLRTIEGEIIPRLMLLTREQETLVEPAAGGAEISDADHARFLEVVMHESSAAACAFVDAMLARGVPLERIFLELLTDAARRLGEFWEEDTCDFSDVTIGLCRLHELLRVHSVVNRPTERGFAEGPRILLATACADQHVLGVVMVAEFFRRAGWRVWSEPGAGRGQIAAILSRAAFDVLGLSAACSVSRDEVASEIETFRKASRNRELLILVGGRLFVVEPTLVGQVGADGVATDAQTAPAVGKELLARPATPC